MRIDSLATMNINSGLAMGINSGAALGIKSVGTMDLHATGQLGIGAGGLVNMDGTLVNIGNGTASATGGLAATSITASIAPQLIQKATGAIPNVSIAEIAKVVKPQEITNVVTPEIPAVTKRWWHGITSIMRSDDD